MSDLIYLRGTPKELRPVIISLMATYQLLESKDVGTIYGEPIFDYQARRKFKPQIELYFKEDEEDVLAGYRPVEGRISFRIMNEESKTISKAELKTLAGRIKEVFSPNNGYVWRKGKELYSYTDVDKGYNLQILARNESGAKDVAAKVLSIQGHTPDYKNMNQCKNLEELDKYPYIPPNQIILGETVKVPRYRPNVEVRFQWAAAHIHGLSNPIILYSRGTRKSKALVI